jgi:hypothetical protein
LCRKLNVSWLACKICFFVSLFAHCFDTLKKLLFLTNFNVFKLT